jgi:hypothetical protein
MQRPVLALAATVSLFWCPAQEKRKQRPPVIEIVEIHARRVSGRVSLDGKVRNTGEQTVEGVLLLISFEAPGRQVVTTKRGAPEIDTLEGGEESEFHLETADPVRAVRIRIEAIDRSERDLKVTRAGPYPIE